jgi:hypothetical protein
MVFMAILLELGSVVFEGLVVGAVLLVVEGPGVGSGDRAGDAGEDRQGDKGGYDGLHGCSPRVGSVVLRA